MARRPQRLWPSALSHQTSEGSHYHLIDLLGQVPLRTVESGHRVVANIPRLDTHLVVI